MNPHYDAMQPLKVSLPSYETAYKGSMMYPPQMKEPSSDPEFSSSQWTDTVNSLAPFLDAQGLRRAFAILDAAVYNVQRAKAIDDLSNQTVAGSMRSGDLQDFQNAALCGMMQAQVQQQQMMLYQELLQLPHSSACKDRFGAMSFGVPPVQAPQQMPRKTSTTPPASDSGCTTNSGTTGGRRRAPQTLSTSLQIIENEDPECLVIVRRISKLGFKATRALKNHFSAQGPVVKVLLAHSTARQYCDQQFHVKRRPSNLGFVQMGSAEHVKKVLALGSIQEVDGVSICVQPFEKHDHLDEQAEEDAADAEDVPTKLSEGKLVFGKTERCMSDASTAVPDDSPKHSA